MSKVELQYRAWRQRPEAEGVMSLFRRLAENAMAHGRRFGMKGLAEVVRWEIRMSENPDEPQFKVNNSYISCIARELKTELPGLEKFIEMRKTRAERSPFPPEWMGRVKSPRLIPTHAMESRHGR